MLLTMTSPEFDALADLLQRKYLDRVMEEGATFTQRQMARELGDDISEETLRRLMNKRIKKRGLDVRTLRALVNKYGHEVLDVLGVTPKF